MGDSDLGRGGRVVSLARDERPIRAVDDESAAPVARSEVSLVIAVASASAARREIIDALGDIAPVLLVSSVDEAVELLADRDPSPQPAPPAAPGPAGTRLLIDSDARLAVHGDREVDLSPLEHDLLLTLHEADGHVRTFDWLQRHVWHNDYQGGRSHVQSVVKRLRHKLHAIGSPLQVETVRGVGLRLSPVPGLGG